MSDLPQPFPTPAFPTQSTPPAPSTTLPPSSVPPSVLPAPAPTPAPAPAPTSSPLDPTAIAANLGSSNFTLPDLTSDPMSLSSAVRVSVVEHLLAKKREGKDLTEEELRFAIACIGAERAENMRQKRKDAASGRKADQAAVTPPITSLTDLANSLV